MSGRLDMVARPKGLAGECLTLLAISSQVACSTLTRFSQVWRPATAFLFGGISFTAIPFLYDVFLIYRNSSALERDT
jgi:hypothetical protein